MEMDGAHRKRSSPEDANLTPVPSEWRPLLGPGTNTDARPLKVAKLDTTHLNGVETRREISKLCSECTKLGKILYDMRLEGRFEIPILRYPRDSTCKFCTILHEKVGALRRRYSLEATTPFTLGGFDGYKDTNSRLLRILLPAGFEYPQEEYRGNIQDLTYRYFEPADLDRSASTLRPEKVGFNQIRNWCTFCKTNHKKLCNATTTQTGQRPYQLIVIDCLTHRLTKITTEMGYYVTLSYVWGTAMPACHLDIGSYIDFTLLERTIQDTITVTLELGLRYLWVDRYCITQYNTDEKHLQIQYMGEIYANSFLTVIACAGDDAEAGLPGVGSTLRHNNVAVVRHSWMLQSSAPPLRFEILDSIWSTRGWTFQEGLLAKRRLAFSASGVYFQCAAMHCDENTPIHLESLHLKSLQRFREKEGQDALFPMYGIGKSALEIIPSIWQYIGRQFSYESDAFEAFLGILSVFEKSTDLVAHVGGLPVFSPGTYAYTGSLSARDMFILALGWRIYIFNRNGGPILRRPTFPSWTWLGWRRTGLEGGRYLEYPDYTFARTIPKLEERTILQLPTPLGPDPKISTTIRYPTHLEIRAFVAKLGLQDGNKLPSMLLDTDLYEKRKKPRLCKDLAMVVKKHFLLLECSTLDFEDMLLLPLVHSDGRDLHTLILCFDLKSRGYTRLPYTVRFLGPGDLEHTGEENWVLRPTSSNNGTMTFEQRIIELV